MAERIKAVQIGVGHDHAFAVVRTLSKRTDIFDFVGYVVLDGEEALYEERKWLYKNAKRISLSEAWAVEGLQAAFIETEDHNLTEYAYMAAKRGLAVHMDKPGGQDGEAFDTLVDYCKEHKIVFHTGYMYRYNPAIAYILTKLRNGDFGKTYYVEAQMNSLQPKEKREWLQQYKGGMMNFLGCHLVDLVLQIQGMPKEIVPYNTCSHKDGVGSEDSAFALFKYEDGISFIKTTAVEAGGFTRRQLVICCEKATVEINPLEAFSGGDLMTADVYITDTEKGKAWTYRGEKQTFGPFERYETMYLQFADMVLGKKENPYTYAYEKTLHKALLNACGIQSDKR